MLMIKRKNLCHPGGGGFDEGFKRYYINWFNLVHMTFDLLNQYFTINN